MPATRDVRTRSEAVSSNVRTVIVLGSMKSGPVFRRPAAPHHPSRPHRHMHYPHCARPPAPAKTGPSIRPHGRMLAIGWAPRCRVGQTPCSNGLRFLPRRNNCHSRMKQLNHNWLMSRLVGRAMNFMDWYKMLELCFMLCLYLVIFGPLTVENSNFSVKPTEQYPSPGISFHAG